jgi:beta-galactosidase
MSLYPRFGKSTAILFAIALSWIVTQAQSNQAKAGDLLRPDSETIYVGVDYYPEHWPEDRWETDFRLMSEAGFNVVRLAEFAWIFMEPHEGEFNFAWLDRVLELAQKYNIRVILGTPSAVMPAWLAKKYPEALAMKPDGTRIVWGGRRHNCFTNADYHRLSMRMARQMAEHYAHNPAVIGWQIDNELGGTDCRCETCRTGFQNWLEQKYGSLEELHKAWGSHFWGLRFTSWNEIPIPDERAGKWAISNPSASLDWMRYTSQLNVDFLKEQADILRGACPPSHFVTHNLMGLHDKVDYYNLAKSLDFVAWDNYPNLSPDIPYDSSLSADVMRGLKKKNFLIMEQTAGPLGWETFSRNPQPGELRKICYQQLAHGADGQIWFRWRTCTVGREQYWHGLLGHDGITGRRYQEAAQVVKEYHQLAGVLAGTKPHNEIAIVYDYDSIWALQFQGGYPNASHTEAIKRYYRPLFRAGVGADIVKPSDDLSQYKLAFAPHLHVLSDDVAKKLTDYVNGGGVLLTDCRTAVKDETNLAYARTLPGLLSEPLGIQIEEYESLRLGIGNDSETTYPLKGEKPFQEQMTAVKYADWIKPQSANALVKYNVPHLRDFAAVTRNEFGDGTAWYVGTIVEDQTFYDQLIKQLLEDAKITAASHLPDGVEIATRRGNEYELMFVINHTNENRRVDLPQDSYDVLTKANVGEALQLEPFGIAILKLPSSNKAAQQDAENN